MDQDQSTYVPAAVIAILRDTEAMGFNMASDRPTGMLLRTLAASKPGGRFLELGTGTGHSAAWMLDGMDDRSTLLTVDKDPAVVEVARRHLGQDPRLRFHVGDGAEFLTGWRGEAFDFIFADSFPGKYHHLEEALRLLTPGAFFVIDDMIPQPNWVDLGPDHPQKAQDLIATLQAREDLASVFLDWSTGLLIAVRRNQTT